MPKYVALLRGINVGGARKVAMSGLREVFAGAGASEVSTYIQSGNVVFAHAARSESKLAAQLQAVIATATGFEVPVVLRTAADFARIIAANPFSEADPRWLHVSFLPTKPASTALDRVNLNAHAPERFVLLEREIYLCLPNGLGRSKLALLLSRQKAIAAATTRNWNTVRALNELAAG